MRERATQTEGAPDKPGVSTVSLTVEEILAGSYTATKTAYIVVPAFEDIGGSSKVNTIDVQLVINAALGP